MDDASIVALYFQRSERALKESRKKYGSRCFAIARRILSSKEDGEEVVNDVFLQSWQTIPPERPSSLGAFLGRITRNLSIDRLRRDTAKKRKAGETVLCLDELEEVVGTGEDLSAEGLGEALNAFLGSLPADAREVFMLRYWSVCPVKEVARRTGRTEGAVRVSLHRTREKLREFLLEEGFAV